MTKVTPKELLPIYDRPVIHFALKEALAVGAERVVIVVHPSKTSICDYLAVDHTEIQTMHRFGEVDLRSIVRDRAVTGGAEIVFVTQKSPLGLGHAVLCCMDEILPGPIGVILPDDVIFGEACLVEMAQDYVGGHMVAAMEVEPDVTSQYGIFMPKGRTDQRNVSATGVVEKPTRECAPSNLAAVGRYILDPVVMRTLASTAPGRGNEIQLTDAIARDASSMALTAFRFSGIRFDCGSLEGLIEAGVARREMLKQHKNKVPARLVGQMQDKFDHVSVSALAAIG